MTRIQVGILIYPDVEVLDFAGPYEVFTVTRLNQERRREEPSPFAVSLVAEALEPVAAAAGMRVLPDVDLATCPPLDILVVPGGWGSRAQMHNDRLLDWLRNLASRAQLLASVCTGSLILGRAGLLDGRRVTTHWMALDLLRETAPAATVERQWHVIDEGKLVTSAGIAAGIDMALRVVARYHGEAVARATARYMEYPYPETNERRVDF